MEEIKELEIGEYIRDKEGNITKIQNTLNLFKDVYLFLGEDDYQYSDNSIKKYSKNIIDLIEVGDYVNGRLVLHIDYKNKNVCLLIPLTDTKANTNIMWYGYEDIRTVVTKEQFERESYKVEKE